MAPAVAMVIVIVLVFVLASAPVRVSNDDGLSDRAARSLTDRRTRCSAGTGPDNRPAGSSGFTANDGSGGASYGTP